MGTGDWNDGMNLVGFRGKGESIWMGFFLHEVLVQFARIAMRRGDAAFVERLRNGGGRPAPEHRAAWLGWALVSPRIFR